MRLSGGRQKQFDLNKLESMKPINVKEDDDHHVIKIKINMSPIRPID